MADPKAITDNHYVGDGARVLFPFSFEYISVEDIRVSLDLVDTTEFSLDNATTVRMNTPPAQGVDVRVYRQTNEEELAATFYPGSAIRSQDLNDDLNQLLFLIQEGAADVNSFYWDKNNETTYLDDQVKGNVPKDDDHIMTNAALIERHDTILSPDSPGSQSQPGKFWVNTSNERIIYWNDKLEAWVDTSQTGPQGPAGTVTITDTVTGDPGTDAIVENTGTPENAVLKFTIPRGDKGEQGEQGIQGETGETGPIGPESTVPGPQGPSGTATVGTTTTGEPGTDALVTTSGTPENQIFDFVIPRGDVGPVGPQGAGVMYMGTVDPTTTDAPVGPNNGDFFVSTVDGLALPSWVGVGDVLVNARLVWNAANGEWDNLPPADVLLNLGYTPSATNGLITNTAGDDATIPAATAANAGLLTAADKTRLDGMPDGGGNQGTVTNVTGHEPIYITGTSTTTPDINVRSATTAQSGVVQLVDSVSNDSHILVPVAANVKEAYELAASKTSNTGTVTSIATSGAITGGPITSSGTIGVRYAGKSQSGVVQIASTTTEGDSNKVANGAQIKEAYELAASKWDPQTPQQLLNSIKTVDGHNSGLDADTLDGKHASEFSSSFVQIKHFDLSGTTTGTIGTVSITPTSSANKVLILASSELYGHIGSNRGKTVTVQLQRPENTSIYQLTCGWDQNGAGDSSNWHRITCGGQYLDAPATTGNVTYWFKLTSGNTAGNTRVSLIEVSGS